MDVYLQSPSAECRLGLFDQATGDPLSGYVLHVSLPDTGSGGLAHLSDGWIAALDPAAQRQLRTAYWNDVRLHYAPGRITVRINGWKALDVHTARQDTHPVHIALGTANRTRPFAGETYEYANRTTALEETTCAMQAILIASTLAVGLASSDSSDGAGPTITALPPSLPSLPLRVSASL